MDFSLMGDQEALKSSVRDFLRSECTSGVVRETAASEDGFSPELWRKIAELGWAGLVVPEEFGGVGLGWAEAVLVADELGRSLFPGPLATGMAAAAAIVEAGTTDQKQRFLPGIADGSVIPTFALLEGRNYDPDSWATKATAHNGVLEVTGTKLFVPFGHLADLFVVAVGGDGGATAVIVERGEGVRAQRLPVVDQTRPLAVVEFAGAATSSDNIVSRGAAGVDLLRHRAALLLAAESSGIASRCLEMSVDFAKTRQQFGKPIGSYQAVSHTLADMFLAAEHATSLLYYAAWAADNDPQAAPLAVLRASSWNTAAARKAALDAIQIHGGIGFTWEHDLHLYLKRAKANEFLVHEPTLLRQDLADALFDR